MSWMSLHLMYPSVVLGSAVQGLREERTNAGILVKSREWQEGNDTTGISSAVNKEKLHFHINDILRKKKKQNRQERQRKEHISACF